MSLLKNYFWWTYERGSLHYDVMVSVILVFLFVAPHYIDFKDKPVTTVPLSSSEVLVKNAGTGGAMVFEVRAADLHGAADDAAIRSGLQSVIQPIAGDVTVDSYSAIKDAHGTVVAYDASVSR